MKPSAIKNETVEGLHTVTKNGRLSEIRERMLSTPECTCEFCEDTKYVFEQLDRSQRALEIAKGALKRVEERTRIMVWEDACPATINSIVREALARIGEG